MKNQLIRLLSLLSLLATPEWVHAQGAGTTFTYQGRISANGTVFSGAGMFKFALVKSYNTGEQAAAAAQLTGNFVTAVNVVSSGSGYTVAPTISLSGGGGFGATATAMVSGGQVTAINVNSAGSGYTNAPMVTIAPPDASTTEVTYWSNDGSSVAGSEPAAAVPVNVANGLFTVVLGETNKMAMLSSSLFSDPELQLKMWFNDGTHGSAALSPLQKLTPTPYAVMAQGLAGVIENNTLSSGQFAVVGGGMGNTSSNNYSTVSGGVYNFNSGYSASIGGGYYNVATNSYATIAGGAQNKATGVASTIAGGSANVSSNSYATVSGGSQNVAGGNSASVGGGSGNQATGYYSTVAGGEMNFATGSFGTVAGGGKNVASGLGSVIGGGGYNGSLVGNSASGVSSTIGGGFGNTNNGGYATIAGGAYNLANTGYSTLAGGSHNTCSGYASTVCGGQLNAAAGDFSFAAGVNAQALHSGSFVWSDFSGTTFASTANNQFAVRASGGMMLAANVQIGTGAGDYRRVTLGGGNSSGFIYGSYPRWGDGIHLGYNYYSDETGANHIIHTDGGTSRISLGYGSIILATGGVGFQPTSQKVVIDAYSTTVNGTFNNNSDRNAKQDFTPIDPSTVLDKVAQLPITEWSYKDDTNTRHLGPMAQDFRAAFNIGTDERHLAPIDEGGVALAAIQGLNQKLNDKISEIERLQKRLEKLEQLLSEKAAREQ
jgi:hypothetical protein